MQKEKTFICTKCNKEKTATADHVFHEGEIYCCEACCGDPSKGEHKEKKKLVCEFC